MTQAEIEKAAEEWIIKKGGPFVNQRRTVFAPDTNLVPSPELVDAFIAGAEYARPKWISVDERLPKLYDEVLVAGNAGKGPFVHIAELDTDDTDNTVWWNGDPYRWMPGMITHWMPLPPAPETDSKDKEQEK